MGRFYSVKIQPIIELQTFGLDGATTEIQFGGNYRNNQVFLAEQSAVKNEK